MPLFAADGEVGKGEDAGRTHAARLAKALAKVLEAVQPEFEKKCEDAVLGPLQTLSRDVLPEIKHTYWTRHNSIGGMGYEDSARDVNVRRLQQEREALHAKLRADVQSSMTALVALQNEMLAAMHDQLHGFERVQRMPRQRSQSQPVLNRRSSGRGQRSPQGIRFSIADTAPRPVDDVQEDAALESDERLDDDERAGLQSSAASAAADARRSDAGDESVDGDDFRGSVEEDDGNESDDEEEGTAEDETQVAKATECGEGDAAPHHVEEPSSRMWVWGRPPSLESGTPLVLRPKQVSLLNGQPLVQVACGGEHLLYLTSTGDVYSYGDNEDKKAANATDSDATRGNVSSFLAPHLVEELALEKALHRTAIATIACGAQHSLAITDAGELYTWGSGEDGRLGHGDMRDRAVPRKVMSLLRESVVGASCGGAHTAVLTAKGQRLHVGQDGRGAVRLGLRG
jgi:hypothetical protein